MPRERSAHVGSDQALEPVGERRPWADRLYWIGFQCTDVLHDMHTCIRNFAAQVNNAVLCCVSVMCMCKYAQRRMLVHADVSMCTQEHVEAYVSWEQFMENDCTLRSCNKLACSA